MNVGDAERRLVEALAPCFPAGPASVLVASALRRVCPDGAALDGERLGVAVALLGRVIGGASHGLERARVEARLRAIAARGRVSSRPPPRAANGANGHAGAKGAQAFVVLVAADDLSRATDASRDLARSLGFSPVEVVRVATATAELARNALLYAGGGDVRLEALAAPRPGIELTVTDRGPGIPDVARVLSETYRSKTGMGMGLKGARRLMDTFEISSSPWGTRVVARRYLP